MIPNNPETYLNAVWVYRGGRNYCVWFHGSTPQEVRINSQKSGTSRRTWSATNGPATGKTLAIVEAAVRAWVKV